MSTKSEIKVALAGCGGVVRNYRKVYAQLSGVCVAVAVDTDEAEARQAAIETNAGKSSANFADALTSDVDAVVISTPNFLHREQAVAAFNAGKHVLLQKPMARTVEECDAILEAAAKSGKTLGVYMNLLDHPLYRDMRRMAQTGYLGTIGLVSARLAHRGGLAWQPSEKLWRASRDKTGGGSYVQLGVHYQHLLRWMLETRVTRVQAFMQNRACPHLEGDDLALVHLELASGAYADVQTSWCIQEEHFSLLDTRGSIHYRDNRRVEFIGEGGPFSGEALQLKGGGKPEEIASLLPPAWDDAAIPFNQHRSFFAALREGRTPEVTGEDGREDVRIMQACHQSAAEERVIHL
ncbi:MAG: Gfo/Idh/MocA family protein [Blastocatellia bacterium]